MKHTPGPWTYQRGAAHPDYDGDPYQIVGADGLYVAKADAVTGREYFEDKNLANARLMAAAPDLLNFVRAFSDARTQDEQRGVWRAETMDEIVLRARELTKKVEGDTP